MVNKGKVAKGGILVQIQGKLDISGRNCNGDDG